jgi:hypothetical protein
MNPLRRMRITYHAWHNPPVWASYYEPPGRTACYCHASSLEEMWGKMKDYFAGNGEVQPLRVDDRLMKYLRPNERYVGLTRYAPVKGRS